MRAAGINTVLTYTVPPQSFLDEALVQDLRVIVNIPWMEYVCFLQSRAQQREVRREVRDAVRKCQRHPAVSLYCVGKEIPPQVVRWHGRRRIERFLGELCDTVKQEDPQALASYTNFPTTEYLDLSFVDVYTYNVYLHERNAFCRYLSRLQHLAGERPLVLTEFGMCSLRNGRDAQAGFLDWQLEEIVCHGAAGAVVFGWTDHFYVDHRVINDWGFGLVDAEGRPKPALETVRRRFSAVDSPAPAAELPRVSVVVAAYNAAATLEECLQSLLALQYPDYEVIVVDDGSKDRTAEIARQFPIRLIRTPNQGLSCARNEGIRAATGEIVAFIDADAWADPDWLTRLLQTFHEGNFAGVGGPNPVPPGDSWLAKCVYRSPGGPTHVMLDDQSAEHIPGCNMAFRKSALEAIGGFDPIFTDAGDDVDLCWRLLERGWQLGYSPAAVVWHHRRPSVRAWWRQQAGYGRAEALLERKSPEKFNPWGHTRLGGRIYGSNPHFRWLDRPTIYYGLWGSAGFQSVYNPGGAGLLSYLPRAMEAHAALLALAALSVLQPWLLLAVGLGALGIGSYAVLCATRADISGFSHPARPAGWSERLKWRAMIAWLHFLQPIARDWGRLRGGLTPWRATPRLSVASRPTRWWQRLNPFRRKVVWEFRGGVALEKYSFLERLRARIAARGCAVGWNSEWEDCDLKVRRGQLGEVRLYAAVEHHGGPYRLLRLLAIIRPLTPVLATQAALLTLATLAAASGWWPLAGALATLLAASVLAPWREAGRLEKIIHTAAMEANDEARRMGLEGSDWSEKHG
jgi:GT2 family glycosyltransferase